MTLVVDASIALGWLFDVPHAAAARALLRRREHLIAPDLLAAEITNAAWKFVQFDGLDRRPQGPRAGDRAGHPSSRQ